jgi:hypothetical protein
MMMNVLMPPTSQVISLQIENENQTPGTYVDDQSPVAWDLVEIPPGEKRTVVMRYSIPDAIGYLGDERVFDFVMFPQATVNPDTYTLSIHPPPGSSVIGPSGAVQSDGSVEFSGVLQGPVTTRVEMSLP